MKTPRALPRLPFLTAGLRALALAGLLAVAGCDGAPEPGTPGAAAHQLGQAAQAGQADQILAVTTALTRERLTDLHGKISGQRAAIANEYPPDARGATRLTYPEGVMEAESPEALFTVLIQPWLSGLDRDGEGLVYGLGPQSVRMDGEAVAYVSTRGGEMLKFTREGEAWVTTAFEDALKLNLDRAEKNQVTLENNLLVFKELARRAAKQAEEGAAGEAAGEGEAAGDGAGQAPSP